MRYNTFALLVYIMMPFIDYCQILINNKFKISICMIRFVEANILSSKIMLEFDYVSLVIILNMGKIICLLITHLHFIFLTHFCSVIFLHCQI